MLIFYRQKRTNEIGGVLQRHLRTEKTWGQKEVGGFEEERLIHEVSKREEKVNKGSERDPQGLPSEVVPCG